MLTPPPGHNESATGRKGGAKGEGPKTFKFDRSYWSFDHESGTYGMLYTVQEDTVGIVLRVCSGPGQSLPGPWTAAPGQCIWRIQQLHFCIWANRFRKVLLHGMLLFDGSLRLN